MRQSPCTWILILISIAIVFGLAGAACSSPASLSPESGAADRGVPDRGVPDRASDGPMSTCDPGAPGPAPGMWGTNDTSRAECLVFPEAGEFRWYGAHRVEAQWAKIFPDHPSAWKLEHHAKGEPPGNLYYLYKYDRALPQGTQVLIEGDFPHARFFDIQVGAPWRADASPAGDGTGLPEIPLLDEDIEPDPGSVNPYRPGADRTAGKRHYHVTLELRDGDPCVLDPKTCKPPYRDSGNLRVGGTRRTRRDLTQDPTCKTISGEAGFYIFVRIYLPDHYDKWAGVRPPVLRLQRPEDQQPWLAPPTREVELNNQKLLPPYPLEANPAREDGLSEKEAEGLAWLEKWAGDSIAQLAPSGSDPATAQTIQSLAGTGDGTVWVSKIFNAPYYIAWLKHMQAADFPTFCSTTLPAFSRFCWGMSPQSPPPGNDEHMSGSCNYNTYLNAPVAIGPDQLLVIRGQAPRTPRTLCGQARLAADTDLRYFGFVFSVGQQLRLTPIISVTDEDMVLDKNRRYTLVLGRGEHRPANVTAENGFTFRAWSQGVVLNGLIRVLSTRQVPWSYAPQLVTWDDQGTCAPNKHAVRDRMGPYFFEARYLKQADLEQLKVAGEAPFIQPKVCGECDCPPPKE